MARVLADRIEQGQFPRADALSIAREILFESPEALLGMRPRRLTTERSSIAQRGSAK
jgi:hypothetical protein